MLSVCIFLVQHSFLEIMAFRHTRNAESVINNILFADFRFGKCDVLSLLILNKSQSLCNLLSTFLLIKKH